MKAFLTLTWFALGFGIVEVGGSSVWISRRQNVKPRKIDWPKGTAFNLSVHMPPPREEKQTNWQLHSKITHCPVVKRMTRKASCTQFESRVTRLCTLVCRQGRWSSGDATTRGSKTIESYLQSINTVFLPLRVATICLTACRKSHPVHKWIA